MQIEVLFALLILSCFVWVVIGIAWRVWRRYRTGPHYPSRKSVNILFEEKWTSANSMKSFLTRVGGAANCARITLTDSELWITLHSPFVWMARDCDLDHRIPHEQISNVTRDRSSVRVTVRLDTSTERTFVLFLRRADAFMKACIRLGIPTEHEAV